MQTVSLDKLDDLVAALRSINNVSFGQVTKLLNLLRDVPRSRMQKLLDTGALARILENGVISEEFLLELLQRSPANKFSGFLKTEIEIGTYKKIDDLIDDAIAIRPPLTGYASTRRRIENAEDRIYPRIKMHPVAERIRLIKVSLRDLGFGNPGISNEVMRLRAAKYGLSFCPPEVGLQSMIQPDAFKDFPGNIKFAMDPLPLRQWFGLSQVRYEYSFRTINGQLGVELTDNGMKSDSSWQDFASFIFMG